MKFYIVYINTPPRKVGRSVQMGYDDYLGFIEREDQHRGMTIDEMLSRLRFVLERRDAALLTLDEARAAFKMLTDGGVYSSTMVHVCESVTGKEARI